MLQVDQGQLLQAVAVDDQQIVMIADQETTAVLREAHGMLQLTRLVEDLGHAKFSQCLRVQLDAHFRQSQFQTSSEMSFDSTPAA